MGEIAQKSGNSTPTLVGALERIAQTIRVSSPSVGANLRRLTRLASELTGANIVAYLIRDGEAGWQVAKCFPVNELGESVLPLAGFLTDPDVTEDYKTGSRSFAAEAQDSQVEALQRMFEAPWSHGRSGPVLCRGAQTGLMVALCDTGPFTEEQGAILDMIAATIGQEEVRTRVEDEIRKGFENQRTLESILRISMTDLTLDKILLSALDAIFTSLWVSRMPQGSIYLREDDDKLHCAACRCRSSGGCTERSCSRIIRDFFTDEATFAAGIVIRKGNPPHPSYVVPILWKDELLGVIDIALDPPGDMDEQGALFLESVAGTLASVIQRKRAETALLRSKEELEDAHRQLQENQAQLLQSEKLASLGQLAAGVAHEINNPAGFVKSNLNSLGKYARKLFAVIDAHQALAAALESDAEMGLLQDLASTARDTESEAKLGRILDDLPALLAESIDGMNRIQKIVSDLRNFSHVDRRDVEQVNLNDLIEQVINVAWNELKYKAEVIRDYNELPQLRCFGGQISQVFLNLLINSAQAIEDRGTITIVTRADGDTIVAEVADTGCGIPQKAIDKIFDPFFTTKPVGKGTGLGLSIVHNIVQSHGGHLSVESTPGEGTCFTLRLPISGPPEDNAEESAHDD